MPYLELLIKELNRHNLRHGDGSKSSYRIEGAIGDEITLSYRENSKRIILPPMSFSEAISYIRSEAIVGKQPTQSVGWCVNQISN